MLNRLLLSTLFTSGLALTALPMNTQAIGISYDSVLQSFSTTSGDLITSPTAPKSIPYNDYRGYRGTGLMNKITLFDDTGILLAAMGTAGGREASRQAAIREGRNSYRYTQYAVVGAPSFISFGFGKLPSNIQVAKGDSLDDYQDVPAGTTEGDFSTMDFQAALPSFDVPLPDFYLNQALWASWHQNKLKINGESSNNSWLGFVYLLQPVYALPYNLSIHGQAGLDMISLLDILTKNGRLGTITGLELQWAPLPFVNSKVGFQRIATNITATERQFSEFNLNAGVGLNIPL
jgi:hypothetical protein